MKILLIKNRNDESPLFPRRPAFQQLKPGEDANGNEAAEAEKNFEKAAKETLAVYLDNWTRLQQSMENWRNSDNDNIKAIADKCAAAVADAGLQNPSATQNLDRRVVQKNIKKISGIIVSYSQAASKAKWEKPAKEESKPGEPAAVSGAESKEKQETLDQAYERYKLVYAANLGTINQWVAEIEKGRPVTDDKEQTVGQMAGFAQQLEQQYGTMKKESFKDVASVDRVIAGINAFFEEKPGALYNGLMDRHRQIMAQRHAEKQKNKPA